MKMLLATMAMFVAVSANANLNKKDDPNQDIFHGTNNVECPKKAKAMRMQNTAAKQERVATNQSATNTGRR